MVTEIVVKKQINWQPQHFPVGTVVHLEGFKRVVREDKEEIITDFSVSFVKIGLDITVAKVIQNSPSNYLVETKELNVGCGVYYSYNFDHITSIVKRGDGPVKVEYFNDRFKFRDTKRIISNQVFNKNRYYWHGGMEIVWHLINQSNISKELSVKKEFIDFFMKQSFIKKEILFPDTLPKWIFYSVDKKKARRFVQQNINRWIKPMKQVRFEAQEEADRDYQNYCSDLDIDYHNG